MYLGIDIGSVSIKLAIINKKFNIVHTNYLRTNGDVISATKRILSTIPIKFIFGIGVTGSGREFVKNLVEADLTIDEITAHRIAAKKLFPKVKTIFEIGGQDSKLINYFGNSVSFEMNNACAAGTGSFLDQQAARFGMSIEDFYKNGLKAKRVHSIASKCTVFAESDMIHAQQSGKPIDEIIRGLHQGMINNYFSQFCVGKKLEGQFIFEGATSENDLLVEEFRSCLLKKELIKNKRDLIVPKPYNKTMGAIGAALVILEKGFVRKREIPRIEDIDYLESRKCYDCSNKCGAELTVIRLNNKELIIGRSCQT